MNIYFKKLQIQYKCILINLTKYFSNDNTFKKKTAGERGSGKASLQEEKAKGQAAYVSGSTSPLLAC